MAFRVLHHLNTGNISGIPEEARWAEELGFDGLCTEETGHDPLLPLALAATTTSRVTLEPRVAIAFPRSPMVFAYASMDLQKLSGGRFRLGLGTQVKGHIERRFSSEWRSPGPRIREYVQSLRAIWEAWQEGTRLSYHGDHYNFNLMTPFFSPGPSEQPPPPVFISAVNAYNCRVAGEVCDGVSLHPLNSPKFIQEKVSPHVSSGAAGAGRNPADVILTGAPFVITGANKGEIKERSQPVRQQIATYSSTRSYTTILETHGFQDVVLRLHEMSLKGQWDEMPGLITDDIFEAFVVAEEYDQVAPALKSRYDGLLDEVVFGMPVNSPDDERQLAKIISQLQE